MRDIRVATVQFQHAAGDEAHNVGPAHIIRQALVAARRPELYESLTRPTGREQETRRVPFGE